MHPSHAAMYQQSQQAQASSEQSEALRALMPAPLTQSQHRSVKSKADVSFVTPQSIQKMLREMNLPHKIDHHTSKFYQQVCTLYVEKVFALSMDYANQRQSTNVEMKDLLRAMRKYSVVPPNQWNHVKLKGSHPLRRNRNRNAAMATHKRRLNIARKNQKLMDKSANRNK